MICNFVSKEGRRCNAEVFLMHCNGTAFPHAEPELFRQGLHVAKWCPKCGFITGYEPVAVMGYPPIDREETKRKHDRIMQIIKGKKFRITH